MKNEGEIIATSSPCFRNSGWILLPDIELLIICKNNSYCSGLQLNNSGFQVLLCNTLRLRGFVAKKKYAAKALRR
jgi:hypothetical protein